jgi:TusA-related sulfurtransferase
MDLTQHCPEKLMTAAAAVSKIKSGSRVFIGTGCGEPQHLIRAMVNDMTLQDIMIYQMLSSTLAEYVDDPSFLRRFSLKLFFISRRMRTAAFEGKIDYIPHRIGCGPDSGQPAGSIRILQPGCLGGHYESRHGQRSNRHCSGQPQNADHMGGQLYPCQ